MKVGWEIKMLGDICDFEGGSQPPKSQFKYEEKPGYVRFLQIRDFASDKNITYIPVSKKNSDLVIVRPNKEVNPHFLAAFFNSAFGKQLVLGKIVGAAQKHFNVTAAKEVMLHIPPMSEQLAIIDMVDLLRTKTQNLESIYQQKLAALDALKKSLLDQAFSGNL